MRQESTGVPRWYPDGLFGPVRLGGVGMPLGTGKVASRTSVYLNPKAVAEDFLGCLPSFCHAYVPYFWDERESVHVGKVPIVVFKMLHAYVCQPLCSHGVQGFHCRDKRLSHDMPNRVKIYGLLDAEYPGRWTYPSSEQFVGIHYVYLDYSECVSDAEANLESEVAVHPE